MNELLGELCDWLETNPEMCYINKKKRKTEFQFLFQSHLSKPHNLQDINHYYNF